MLLNKRLSIVYYISVIKSLFNIVQQMSVLRFIEI